MSKILYLDVLEGSHQETAFLEIRVNDECIVEQVAPLVPPMENEDDEISFLVNHIDSVTVRRSEIASFFAEQFDVESDLKVTETMENRINHHGLHFLDVTGSYVGKDLPFYTATFV